jgi:hypothetical protein
MPIRRKSTDWNPQPFDIAIVLVIKIEIPNDNSGLISSMIQIG